MFSRNKFDPSKTLNNEYVWFFCPHLQGLCVLLNHPNTNLNVMPKKRLGAALFNHSYCDYHYPFVLNATFLYHLKTVRFSVFGGWKKGALGTNRLI